VCSARTPWARKTTDHYFLVLAASLQAMGTRSNNETNESNGGVIKWNIKTEAEESKEYLAALGLSSYSELPTRSAYKFLAETKLNRLSTSDIPQPRGEATRSVERPFDDGLTSDEDVYVAYAVRHDASDRQGNEDADEDLHLLHEEHEEGRPPRKRRSNKISNGAPTLLRDDAAHPPHAPFTHASPISSEEQLLQSTPEPPETDLTAENTEHESSIPLSDKGPRPKVIRFFSRVRVTSGVGRGRSPRSPHGDSSIPANTALSARRLSDVSQRSGNSSGSRSRASSISDSSSFSAPLRAASSVAPRMAAIRHNSKASKAGRQAVIKQQRPRASLSQVLDPNSTNEWLISAAVQDQQRHAAKKGRTWDKTLSQRREMERRRRRMIDAPELSAWAPILDDDSDDEVERAAAEALRKTEADVLYGRWPWRLFNFYVSAPWFSLLALTRLSVLGIAVFYAVQLC